jgi:UDP-N-acetylglucosamine diphosphorylase / glucose-1-phosphate thymidylyltransferase / UDP-N-acetylgalactosamine diphosphorylase / glucosamine-1-phosphate N-acetyltransferase / galactosamine-1-phosphate N-acetyltransferase
MYRYIIEDTRHVLPFNEPASQLTIGTTRLKIHQENLFAEYFKTSEIQLGNTFRTDGDIKRIGAGESIVFRDNLWFDKEFFTAFMDGAKKARMACRAAIPAEDKAYKAYTLPLTRNIESSVDADGNPIHLIDLWYFPDGYTDTIMPVVVPSLFKEKGYYSVPDFMAQDRGDLTHYLAERAVMSIESWVHIFYASVVFGVFSRGSRFEEHIKGHNFAALKLLWRGIIEQKQVLTTSAVVKVGKGTVIDPSAVINGPTVIGENCFIGPGVVIDNSTLGDNVNIAQGCQIMLSTIADNCFLPFRAALFMTAMMENSIVAQNTCLQMCVIGRNSFVGAGNTFTDFNLIGEYQSDGRVIPRSIKAATIDGDLADVGQTALGGAVGHNCRIGSGMIIFPGRMIESDVILFASPTRRVITRNVTFEESDHVLVEGNGVKHIRQYPREEDLKQGERTWERW